MRVVQGMLSTSASHKETKPNLQESTLPMRKQVLKVDGHYESHATAGGDKPASGADSKQAGGSEAHHGGSCAE